MKTGFVVPLYQLTTMAHLAILLDKINTDAFIEKASDASIFSALAAFTLNVKASESSPIL